MMASKEKSGIKTQKYSSDLTDEEWEIMKELLPTASDLSKDTEGRQPPLRKRQADKAGP